MRSHSVESERAGFIGADHGGRAERFHGGEVADEHVAPRHALGSDGERERDGGEQPFRNVGDDDTDGEEEIRPEGDPCRGTDEEANGTDRAGEHSHDMAEAGEFPLEGEGDIARGAREVGDGSELGVGAGGVDEGPGLAGDERGASEEEVAAVQGVLLSGGFGITTLGEGFTGESCVIDLNTEGFDQAAIGGDEVAGLKSDDVARNELVGIAFQERA